MNFAEEHTHKVTLHHRTLGALGEARLTFGGEKPVAAMIGMMSVRAEMDGLSLDFVGAETEDGLTFTLCQCRIHGFSLSATYLVCGEITADRFRGFDIKYSDISEWFLHYQLVKGEVGTQLTWTRLTEYFSADISEGARRFTLSSKYAGSRDQVGGNLILREQVEFSFETPSGDFSLEEVRSKTIELGALLSLLIAYPISVVSVAVATETGRTLALYFGTFRQLHRDDSRNFSHLCLIQKPALDGKWDLLLRNYYQMHERRKLWVRLAGMQRYEGFWDFRLLGYVSLLDQYVTQRANTLPGTLTPPKQQKLDDLAVALHQVCHNLDATRIAEIVQIASRVFSHHRQTFAERYGHAMQATDHDVRTIVALTDTDFRFIKKVRDKIAHGESPEIQKTEFNWVNAIIGKISLLLTSWTLLDLGLPKDDFLKALNSTHSRLRFEAALNEKNLARATRTAAFFSVSPETFAFLASRRDLEVFACFVEGPPGEIELSEHYTQIYRSWHKNPTRQNAVISWAEIFDVEVRAVRYEGTVYIESGHNSKELHSVCVFDKSKLPS